MSTIPALQFGLNLDQFQVSTVGNADGLTTLQSDGLHIESGLPYFTGLDATTFYDTNTISIINHLEQTPPQTLTTAEFKGINLVAGESLVIDLDFVPYDYRYNDFGFSILKDPSGALIPVLMDNVQNYVNTQQTHATVTYKIGSTGSFDLLLGSADEGDALEPSDLIIHSVSIQAPAGDYTLGASGVRLGDGTLLRADGSAVLPGGSVESSFLSGDSSNLVSALSADESAGLISQDGGGLISQDGGGIISQDGGSIISQDGGSIISQDGGSLISQDGGGLISQDGGGLISQDGGGLISNAGGTAIGENSSGLISQDGSTAIGENSSGLLAQNGGGIVGGNEFHVLSLDESGGLNRQFSDAAPTQSTSGPTPGAEFPIGPGVASGIYTGHQESAALSDGKFAVVFDYSQNSSNSGGIGVQLMSADGTTAAPVFMVPATSLNSFVTTADVVSLPGGGFAVAYGEYDYAATAPFATTPNLNVQIFDASGAAVGGPSVVGQLVDQVNSIAAAPLSDGSFVVLQTGTLSVGEAAPTIAQRVSASGAAEGPAVMIGADVGGIDSVDGDAIVGLSNGGFAVAFTDATYSQTFGLYFQTVDADGSQSTPVLIKADAQTGGPYDPSLALLTNGDIAMAWNEPNTGVHVQVVTPAGALVGAEAVGALVEQESPAPAITALSDGRFIVAYGAPNGSDLTSSTVDAQIYNADGTTSGGILAGSSATHEVDVNSPVAIQLTGGAIEIISSHQGDFADGPSLAAEPISLSGTASSSTSEATQQGRAVDGYISGATVFADANGDGKLTAGEATATTDSLGRYSFSTTASGPVILTGGTDTSTGLAFTKTLTAPAGSLTVTPLTTLVQKIEASNGGNLVIAERQVNSEFGLAASTDVTALDPARGSDAGTADAAKAFIAGAIVADTVALAAAAGASGDLYAILGAQIAANPVSFDPTSVASMQALGLTGAVATDVSSLAQASKTLLTQDQAADAAGGQALLLAAAGIEKVAQGATSAALAAGTNSSVVAAAYTGANLAAAVAAAGTPTLLGGGASATTDTVLGGDGVTRSVPFGTAALATLAAPLLAGVAPSTTLFIDNAGAYALSGVQTAAVDDATGPVVLAGDGAANETIAAGGGDLAFQDGAGAGTLVAGAGNDFVRLSNGGDWSVALGGGVDTVVASTGNDTLATGTGGTLMFLGAGASSVASAGADTIIGGAGASTVNATGSALYFNTGAPTLFNALGASATLVGAGDETVNAGSANMLVFGGATGGLDFFAGGGSSTVVSYTGGGTLNGGGAPTLYFGIGPAAYNAGSAVDTVIGYGGGMTATGGTNGTLFFTGAAGGNFLSTGSGSATIIGFGTGDVYAATGGGDSVIDAAGAADTIFGAQSTGANSFFAYAANDVVVGGSGSTAIQSAFGNHTLIAGSGSTLFQVLNSGSNRAITLENFQSGNDFVQLQDYQSGAASSALQTAAVIGGSEVLTLVDGTTVTFQGVAGITAASFV